MYIFTYAPNVTYLVYKCQPSSIKLHDGHINTGGHL